MFHFASKCFTHVKDHATFVQHTAQHTCTILLIFKCHQQTFFCGKMLPCWGAAVARTKSLLLLLALLLFRVCSGCICTWFVMVSLFGITQQHGLVLPTKHCQREREEKESVDWDNSVSSPSIATMKKNCLARDPILMFAAAMARLD